VASKAVCPSCSASFTVPDRRGSDEVNCPRCRDVFRMPRKPRSKKGVTEDLPVAELVTPSDADRTPPARGVLPWVIAGVCGVALLFLALAGGVGVLLLTRAQPKPDPRAETPPDPPPADQNPANPQPPRRPPDQPPRKDPPKDVPPRVDPPRRDPPPGAEAAGWHVEPDPAAEAVKLTAPPKQPIAIRGTSAEVVFPSGPSPFVALGGNVLAADARTVCDLRTGQAAGNLAGKVELSHPVLNTDGTQLAGTVPAKPGSVDVWTLATGKADRVQVTTAATGVDLIDLVGPGRVLVARFGAKNNRVFQVWDVAAARMEREVQGPTSYERDSLALSPGQRYLALVAQEKLQVYDLKTGTLAGERKPPRDDSPGLGTCRGLAFSPDGAELAGLFVTGGKTRLLSWDVARGEVAADLSFPGDLKTTVKHAILYQGRYLDWLADRSGWLVYGLLVIDHDTGNVVATLPADDPTPGPRRVVGKDHVAIVSGSGLTHTLTLVPLPWEQIQAARAAKPDPAVSKLPAPKAADWSAVKELVAATGDTEWKADADPHPAAKGAFTRTPIPLQAKGNDVKQVLFSSPDVGQVGVVNVVQTAGPIPTRQLRLDRFDLATGKPLGAVDSLPTTKDDGTTFSSNPRYPAAALSPDGGLLALRDEKDARRVDLWDTAANKHLVGWQANDTTQGGGYGVAGLWFLDGKRLLTATGSGQVTLWEVPACKAVYRLSCGNGAAVALSPGRKYLAAATGETFNLFDAATGERRGRTALPSPGYRVSLVAGAFSPEGKELAAAYLSLERGKPAVVVHWDLKTGAIAGLVPVQPGPEPLVCSSPGKASGTWGPGTGWSVRRLAWWGPRHVLLNDDLLVDLDRKWLVGRYRLGEWGRRADDSPDDRHWFATGRALNGPALLTGLAVPDEVVKAAAAAARPDTPAMIRPGSSVSLRLDWNTNGPPAGADDFRRKLTENLTAWLKANGVKVEDNQPNVLAVRVAVVDSGRSFTVEEVFEPPAPSRPGGLRPPAPPPMTTGAFQGKKIMAQVLYWDGKSSWTQDFSSEPGGGSVGDDDDPATYQLSTQWQALSAWLASEPWPFFVGKPPQAPYALPAWGTLTPDGAKPPR
jgi:hypothetical protein